MRAHVCTHARTHARTRARTRARTHACTNNTQRVYAFTYASMQASERARTSLCAHVTAQSHIHDAHTLEGASTLHGGRHQTCRPIKHWRLRVDRLLSCWGDASEVKGVINVRTLGSGLVLARLSVRIKVSSQLVWIGSRERLQFVNSRFFGAVG